MLCAAAGLLIMNRNVKYVFTQSFLDIDEWNIY